MKVLHTADWHVGETLKTRSRYDEHRAVLADLVRIARDEDVDAVLIAGDIFDSLSPAPEAQGLVTRTLLDLRADGRHIVALAGNHDNGDLIDAVYRPLLRELDIHLLGRPKRPDAGGTLRLTTRAGEPLTVAALPFLSHRHAVRAAEALLHQVPQHTFDYVRRIRAMVEALAAGFTDDAVNIVMTHATILGGLLGGGERDVQTSFDYALPADVLPATADYAALGHLHRSQRLDGPCPIAYSGAPLAIDFGDEEMTPVALVVEVTPDEPAKVREVPVTGGRGMRTLRGTLDEVIAAGELTGDAYLRVILAQPGRAGLADLVRDKLPNALTVLLDDAYKPRLSRPGGRSRAGRSAAQLFTDYLAEQQIDDARVSGMFADILDEVTGLPVEPPVPPVVPEAARAASGPG
ncbi:MAG: exonuclease SbcCD subunit D [Frankiaceae bacterium]